MPPTASSYVAKEKLLENFNPFWYQLHMKCKGSGIQMIAVINRQITENFDK